jgi:hypothetical protein
MKITHKSDSQVMLILSRSHPGVLVPGLCRGYGFTMPLFINYCDNTAAWMYQ